MLGEGERGLGEGEEGISDSEILSARSLLSLARSWRSRTLAPPLLPRGLHLPLPLLLSLVLPGAVVALSRGPIQAG